MSDNTYSEVSTKLSKTSEQQLESNKSENHYKNHSEYLYLNLAYEILSHGKERMDRTGTGTLSIFSKMMRFNINDEFPLLTTKKMFWKGIVEELLWFISGSTNSKKLDEKGVRIWNVHGSNEFLIKRGLDDRQEGDLGPVYGFQWRHFGAEYKDMNSNYEGMGVDQLKECIRLIKEDPTSRRIFMSSWNPKDVKKMALPPCHISCQFYVEGGFLSCQMYQRSGDVGLGIPFNIASYSLLTYLIAHVTGLIPGDFIHVIGDAHIYLNHVSSLKEQIQRVPFPFPKLNIKRKVTDIDDFKSEDFELVNYVSHPSIKMDMSI